MAPNSDSVLKVVAANTVSSPTNMSATRAGLCVAMAMVRGQRCAPGENSRSSETTEKRIYSFFSLLLFLSARTENQKKKTILSVQPRLSHARRPTGATELKATSSTGEDEQCWHNVSFIVPSIFIVLLLSVSYLLSDPAGRWT